MKEDKDYVIEQLRNLEKLANEGNREAMFTLAGLYHTGDMQNVFPPDQKKAADLFKRAADAGHVDAMYEYGLCHYRELGVQEPDMNTAVNYIKRAADHGNTDAMVDYAMFCINGDVCRQDLAEAFNYFKRSADGGNIGGSYWYGLCLKNGWGVRQDLPQAIAVLRKVVDRGNAQQKRDAQGQIQECQQAMR